MHNMYPVSKSVDKVRCSHFSMDPQQIKGLFLAMRLQTTDTACTRQTVNLDVMTQTVPLSKTQA
jgi:hypothetical protein